MRDPRIIDRRRPARVPAKGISRAALLISAAALASEGVRGNEQLVRLSRDDAHWAMPAKNYASTRFSGLDQIDRSNVQDLEVAWTFSIGTTAGFEAAPLVIGSTMYVTTPWPNVLYALDTADGSLRWSYHPKPERAAKGVACCDVVNRGAAYLDGTVYFNTLDNYTIAVDAETGEEVWKTKLGDINVGETMTMAPLVVKDKVLVGNSGGEMGVRGWLTALDAATGEIAWRAYTTGPDEDVLIGEDFRPYYAADREPDLGVRTWPPERWRIGGGTVWGWISYDPALDLIYYGTANPGPWNHNQRLGDNKWTASVFARDPDTGLARWAYQWGPHDLFDYDGVNENVLLDLEIGGEMRRTLVRPERNGHVYVLDRETGQVLSADTYHYNTVSRGVDLETGRPIEVSEKAPREGAITREICPAAPGAKDWQPSAFSPVTGYLYIPHQNLCMDMRVSEASYVAGTPFVGAEVAMYGGPGGHRGEYTAWDPVERREVWTIEEEFPVWSGTVATAGGIAFYGTMDRWFKAVDAETGDLLWRFRVASGIVGQPVTYLGPDGRQYVAIASGVGGWSGAVVSANLDPRVPFGALGFVGAMQDLPDVTGPGGTLYVFALPERGADRAPTGPRPGQQGAAQPETPQRDAGPAEPPQPGAAQPAQPGEAQPPQQDAGQAQPQQQGAGQIPPSQQEVGPAPPPQQDGGEQQPAQQPQPPPGEPAPPGPGGGAGA